LQFSAASRVSEDIDRFELNPTDREKLFESQAAGSARLPECLQRWLRHLKILNKSNDYDQVDNHAD
jgi:hypothetical protein